MVVVVDVDVGQEGKDEYDLSCYLAMILGHRITVVVLQTVHRFDYSGSAR